MTSISELAQKQIIPRDMPEMEKRKHLSEMVRVAEMEWIGLKDTADRLEEQRKVIVAQMKTNLRGAGLAKSGAEAEEMALCSDEYRKFVDAMHDARRYANEAKARLSSLERDYWGAVSLEASERQQMRMSR